MSDKEHYEGGEAEGEPLVRTYPPKKVIPRRAICKSIQDIEDMHPLRKTVSWHHVAKCCGCLCCCAKK